VLGAHDAAVRRQLDVHRGHEVKTMGDGFLEFDERGAYELKGAPGEWRVYVASLS
jgi:hypothetical protein